MSLLMQALRKAERARSHGGDEHEGDHFGQDAVPSPPPIEGGPAFAVMPETWRLEPLEAEPPVIAAQEAAHDPVPPQARHAPARASAPRADTVPIPPATDGAPRAPEPDMAAEPGVRRAGARPPAPPRALDSSQRRLILLAAALAVLLITFALIYWRAVYGQGPGARLPMVPMPAPGAATPLQAGAPQDAPIPVTPYLGPGGDAAAQGAAATPGYAAAPGVTAAPGATATPASTAMPDALAAPGPTSTPAPLPATIGAASNAPRAAPPGSPRPDVTIPTPAQLAAISDPAIRAEAMRDAAERAARQVQLEGTRHAVSAAAGMASRPAPASLPEVVRTRKSDRISAAPAASASRQAPPTAVGENGDVRFVRSAEAIRVAPAVQNGYTALQSGDLPTARQQYDLALLQDPNNRDALLGSAAVALRDHDGRQASSNYLRLLELDPNDPEALAGLAELRPDLQANEIKLRGLARQHPESGPVQFALGNLYARQGRWPEAQQSYFRAFTAVPNNADYAFNLGVGLDRMNQPRLAQTYYRRALELAQTSPPGFSTDAVRKRLQALETPPQ